MALQNSLRPPPVVRDRSSDANFAHRSSRSIKSRGNRSREAPSLARLPAQHRAESRRSRLPPRHNQPPQPAAGQSPAAGEEAGAPSVRRCCVSIMHVSRRARPAGRAARVAVAEVKLAPGSRH
ncbi:hypothetical protein BDA96_03G266700 [Sorghum bicolor]|uniref:Uncharacterized protein n=1 Tax=Sorghum bicolor TaxID=4558 RepID=A0A921RH07_SORBI|nr:hypothetical protein BDA96_03G266700 [Sorghum bicolor]